MTRRHKKISGVLLEEHPNKPGLPDIIGHRQLKATKMGVRVRGKGILDQLKKRTEAIKHELGLDDQTNNFGERRL